jgi:hypothetical protein
VVSGSCLALLAAAALVLRRRITQPCGGKLPSLLRSRRALQQPAPVVCSAASSGVLDRGPQLQTIQQAASAAPGDSAGAHRGAGPPVVGGSVLPAAEPDDTAAAAAAAADLGNAGAAQQLLPRNLMSILLPGALVAHGGSLHVPLVELLHRPEVYR